MARERPPGGCPAADRLQKLLWLRSVSPYGTPRAASVLTAGGEALRDFSPEGQKIRRFDCSPRHSARNAAADRGRQREPQILVLAFCLSDLPVKISIARGGPKPPRKLLQFRLRIGSPRCPPTANCQLPTDRDQRSPGRVWRGCLWRQAVQALRVSGATASSHGGGAPNP